jgi:5-methylthioadenosine/S-adenosylhomocysteine deaminase
VSELADILIKNGIIVTMDPERRILPDGAVAIENDRLLEIDETKLLETKYSYDRVIDAKDHIVLPGLMDAHAHAGHSLLKSLGQHSGTWYKACEVIYSQASTEGFWEADALLFNLERLRFGVTCGMTFLGGGDSVMRVDDPIFAEKHALSSTKIGVRSNIAVGPQRPPFPRKYSRWSGSARRDYMVSFEDMIHNCRRIIETCHGLGGLASVSMMFPTPTSENLNMSGVELSDLREMADSVKGLTHEKELLLNMDGHRRGTVAFCHKELDLLDSRSILGHSTELTEEEIGICSKLGLKIAHNPSAIASIMGRCPVPELIDADVTVALGSDASAPDRSADMFRHMFQATRYHRRHYRNERILPPGKVLEMVTIDSAKAFCVEDELGSLEAGKKADVILLDMRKPHLYPPNMPVDRVVYYANGNDIDTVIVDGKLLMENREVLSVDENWVLDYARSELEGAVGRSKLNDLFETTRNYWGKSIY